MKLVTIKRNKPILQLPYQLTVDRKAAGNDTIVIDSHSLEQQMDRHLGWVLRDIQLGGGSAEQVSVSTKYMKHFSRAYPDETCISNRITANFERHTEPMCMLYETEAALFRQLETVYQLMYFHYLLGRHLSIQNSFPRYCCGISSRHLTIALWEAGVVAAVAVHNSSHDHSYMLIPFHVRQTGKSGVILADSTSDQLHRSPANKVRNFLAVLPAEDWEYRTNWSGGANLYPELVQVSTCYGKDSRPYDEYLAPAFNNRAVVRY